MRHRLRWTSAQEQYQEVYQHAGATADMPTPCALHPELELLIPSVTAGNASEDVVIPAPLHQFSYAHSQRIIIISIGRTNLEEAPNTMVELAAFHHKYIMNSHQCQHGISFRQFDCPLSHAYRYHHISVLSHQRAISTSA